MTDTALEGDAVVDRARRLKPGDEVELARSNYSWASPMKVDDVEIVEWLTPHDVAGWRSAEITLESTSNRAPSSDNPHVITGIDGRPAQWRQGTDTNPLHQFDPVPNTPSDTETETEPDNDDEDGDGGVACPDCDQTFGTTQGRNIHHGQVHDTPTDELSDGIDEELGLEPAPPDSDMVGTGSLEAATRPIDDVDAWEGSMATDVATNGNVERGESPEDGLKTQGFAAADDETVHDESYFPKECSCGVVAAGRLEWGIHRTEAHDEPKPYLNNLRAGEFLELVIASDTVRELTDELDWGYERTLRAIGIYGLEDVVTGGDIPDDPTANSDLLTPNLEEGPAQ